jgi:dUTP pyrophosphatase
MALPAGYEAQVRPRSGLAAKFGVPVLNSPGTIDSDYRGPLGVILVNLGADTFTVEPGERIAQLVVQKTLPTEELAFDWDDGLAADETDRGAGGFGSTGLQ